MNVSPPVPPQGDPLHSEARGVFDDERLARAAAEQVAQRLRQLQAVGTELLGALTLDAVVHTMVERGLTLLGAVAGAVWMVDPERRRLVLCGHVGYPADVIERFTDLPLDAPAPAAEAALRGERVTLLSVAERDERYPRLAGGSSVGAAFICEPLVEGGETLGVLSASFADGALLTDAANLAFFDTVVTQCSVALHRARTLQREHESRLAAEEIAHTLQRSLLPVDLPAVPGVEVAVRYLPGTRGLSVGGDFYDVVPLSSGRVGLVVGDVMGRGVRAAAVMGQVRAAIRAYVLEGHGPAGILQRLDRLVSSLDEALIVTCFYGEWDPLHARALVACAGHPPPLVMPEGDAPSFLEIDPGVPLGVGGASYREVELTLPPGSLLLAYTDGVVESPDLPVDEGMQRLADVVSGVRSADAACDAALTVQPASDDDVALLALWTLTAVGDDGDWRSELVRDLPADIHSPALARSAVEHVLASWEMDALADTATLLVSEIVTNAVRHAGTSLRLRAIRLAADRVRIEVVDHAPHAPLRRRSPDAGSEGGRGLHLVEHLAKSWGVFVTGDVSKTVWFEL